VQAFPSQGNQPLYLVGLLQVLKKKKILPWSEIEGPSLASAAFVTAIRMLPFTEVFYPFLKTWQSH